MRKLLIGSAAIATAIVATPAAAQIYIGVGQSPYSNGYSRYGYSPYSYGYSPYSYASPYSYGYSPYGYGYSYPSYSYGYSNYSYAYPGYRHRSSYNCLQRHHRNGVVYYTRVC